MKLYKLTEKDGTTKGGMRWEVGKTNYVAFGQLDKPAKLCTNTVLHAYTSPLLAELMNRAHGAFKDPLCFEVEGEVVATDGTKVGCRKLAVTGTFELPVLTTVQKVAFGILCALEVYKESSSFVIWAENWLSGKNRSYKTAAAAADAADAAPGYAAHAAYAAASVASDYAAYSAAVGADDAIDDAAAAAYAADADAVAAYAADAAVSSSSSAVRGIDFQALAEKALEVK